MYVMSVQLVPDEYPVYNGAEIR